MAREVMRGLSFHVCALADVDSAIDFKALEGMTIVGVSLCATVFTGTPTAFDVDIQDDATDVITAITASTALTPGTWLTPHMGGTQVPVYIAAGSEVEVDVNLTAGTTPTATFDLVIYYLGGDQV